MSSLVRWRDGGLHDQLASLGTIWVIRFGVDVGWRVQAGRVAAEAAEAAESRHSIAAYGQPCIEWRLLVAPRQLKLAILASR